MCKKEHFSAEVPYLEVMLSCGHGFTNARSAVITHLISVRLKGLGAYVVYEAGFP